jgi:hypothetical protein
MFTHQPIGINKITLLRRDIRSLTAIDRIANCIINHITDRITKTGHQRGDRTIPLIYIPDYIWLHPSMRMQPFCCFNQPVNQPVNQSVNQRMN